MDMAFPAIILAMTITAAGAKLFYNTILAMVIVSWPNYARVMRSMVIYDEQNMNMSTSRTMGASEKAGR